MQWLLTSHVRRYHKHYGGSGHIWQGRFKSFPVQRNEHLTTVLRYVLQNPVRAGLCGSAREWKWSSLQRPQLVDPCPVADDGQWLAQLDEPVAEQQLSLVRECVNRQRPFGRPGWQAEIAAMFGLASTLRPRGRTYGRRKESNPENALNARVYAASFSLFPQQMGLTVRPSLRASSAHDSHTLMWITSLETTYLAGLPLMHLSQMVSQHLPLAFSNR